jgi:electron transfer flavoprotein alpha subunit
MRSIMIIAEHQRGRLREVTAELVSAGRELKEHGGGSLVVAVLGADVDAVVEAASLAGVDEIVRVPLPGREFNAELVGRAVEHLVRERAPDVILGGFTVSGMGYAPAVAVRLGLGFASDVVGCAFEDGALVARRRFYGGKVEAELEFPAERVFLLLRPALWPLTEEAGSPTVTTVEATGVPDAPRLRHRELVDPEQGDVDITTADVILAIGRGVGERDNIEQFESLAARLGATLAASRPLVDAGWLPAARQVGQSGNTVKPDVYLAFGISGAVQHLAGMKGSKTIIAINRDPDAPVFDVAHYGAVEDIFDVAEELEALL